MWIPDHITLLLRNLYAGQEATIRILYGKTGSGLRKEYNKAVYHYLVYLIYTQNTSHAEMLGWMNYKLESRSPGEISTTSDMRMIPLLMAESEEELLSLLMRVKEESKKAS